MAVPARPALTRDRELLLEKWKRAEWSADVAEDKQWLQDWLAAIDRRTRGLSELSRRLRELIWAQGTFLRFGLVGESQVIRDFLAQRGPDTWHIDLEAREYDSPEIERFVDEVLQNF
jgi:hypothetical protein